MMTSGEKLPDTSVDHKKEAEYTRKLKELVLNICRDFDCRIFLFGSRITGPLKRSSDFDIGIEGLKERDFRVVKERIEEMAEKENIPHEVDVVNFDTAEDPVKSLALKAIEVWKRNSPI